MSFVAVAIGGGALLGLGGAFLESNATNNAAQTQAQSASNAEGLQSSEYQQQLSSEQPWLQSGAAALPQLSSMAENPQTFTQRDFLNNQDPAYQFDTQQGEQAIQRSAAASGGLQSGGTLKALNDYAQNQASNEYQNAYSRFMNTQNTQFNRLASVAGIGQTATGQGLQAGMNYSNNMSNTITGLGNAQAAATTAQGNIWGNTLSSIGSNGGNTLMGYQLMSKFANPYNSVPSTPANVPDYNAGINASTGGQYFNIPNPFN